MKLGIITYHKGGNSGALLQCYALNSVLKRNHYVYIVDYTPKFMKRLNSPYFFSKLKKYDGSRKKLIKLMKTRQKKYSVFLKSFAKYISPKRSNILDCIILGSDQLLNFQINNYDINYLSPSFYKGRLIMYGGSFGRNIILNNFMFASLNKYLKKYDALSFREIDSVNFVQQYFNLSSAFVCDPTFLLDATEYDNLLINYSNKAFTQKFIFVYYPNNLVIKKALNLSKRLGLKIYVISTGQEINPSTEYDIIYDDGPLDFLYLISHSEYNIVGSFHGVCLSIIYNRKFVFYNNNKTTLERLYNLKSVFSLPDCINPESDITTIDFNWEVINKEKMLLSNKSIKWIKENVR